MSIEFTFHSMHIMSMNFIRLPFGLRAAVTGAILGLAALPSVALAHPELVRSTPSADTSLSGAPAEIRLTFSEKAELAVSRIQLFGANGEAVAIGPLEAADAGKTVVAAVGSTLAPGTYAVRWQVVGRDGHPIRGSFKFSVAAAPAASGADSAAHGGHGAHPVQSGPKK